jgi:6-pyruvoyltetrahydropterin/6-carboxytetrahydropterin synthase
MELDDRRKQRRHHTIFSTRYLSSRRSQKKAVILYRETMPILYLTRKEHFNAAHRLWNPNWSDERNLETFGKCANPHFHGHNFDLYVCVKGQPNPDTGCVMDLKGPESDHPRGSHRPPRPPKPQLGRTLVGRHHAQHRNGGGRDLATPESEDSPRALLLHKITLWETQNNFVEYYGE